MSTPYLLAALSLALSDPLALLAETLVMLCYLHLAGAGGYLIFRMMGGEWDGIAFAVSVLEWVHELRTPLTHRVHPPIQDTYPSILTHTDHA